MKEKRFFKFENDLKVLIFYPEYFVRNSIHSFDSVQTSDAESQALMTPVKMNFDGVLIP